MLDINYYMQTLNPFDKLKMKSRYKRGAFMNDELQGDSREYKEAARMYNHDLKEYYRQHNYQVMPEEEENEEIKVIPLREGRNGNPSGYLSALGLKGNEAATVAGQPLRLLKGVDTLSDNKALSRINLSGNKASSSSYPSVRLAQGYGRNTMSDGSTTLLTVPQESTSKPKIGWDFISSIFKSKVAETSADDSPISGEDAFLLGYRDDQRLDWNDEVVGFINMFSDDTSYPEESWKDRYVRNRNKVRYKQALAKRYQKIPYLLGKLKAELERNSIILASSPYLLFDPRFGVPIGFIRSIGSSEEEDFVPMLVDGVKGIVSYYGGLHIPSLWAKTFEIDELYSDMDDKKNDERIFKYSGEALE